MACGHFESIALDPRGHRAAEHHATLFVVAAGGEDQCGTVTGLFAHSLPVMVLAASTHALSFAVFHACCMRLMSEFFPGKRAAAGQSLLYGFSSGVGGVLGAVMAALAWESAGGGRLAFLLGAAVTGVAWMVYAMRRKTPLQPV